jgi:ABC-type proline/glycine betaine transport system substrate-binding protein
MLEVDNKERELEDVVSEWMSDNTIQVQSWVAAG